MRLGLGLKTTCGNRARTVPVTLVVMRTSPANGSYRVKTNVLQAYNDTTLLYHAFFPDGPDGQVRTNFGGSDNSAADADANMTTSWVNGSWRVKTNVLQMWNRTSLLWHAIFVEGAADAPRIVWGPGDNSASAADTPMHTNNPAANWRVQNAILQLWNREALRWHAYWLTGPNNAVREVLGPGVF